MFAPYGGDDEIESRSDVGGCSNSIGAERGSGISRRADGCLGVTAMPFGVHQRHESIRKYAVVCRTVFVSLCVNADCSVITNFILPNCATALTSSATFHMLMLKTTSVLETIVGHPSSSSSAMSMLSFLQGSRKDVIVLPATFSHAVTPLFQPHLHKHKKPARREVPTPENIGPALKAIR